MFYLALDQALQTTGYAVFDDNTLIENSIFTIPANQAIEVRLSFFFKKLTELHNEYNFHHIFFEDIQYQNNIETYKKLAYCQSAILLWCFYNDMSYTILSPSHWRKSIKSKYGFEFGKSRAQQKKVAQEVVQTLFQIKVTSDEADAICIGIAGWTEKQKQKSAF